MARLGFGWYVDREEYCPDCGHAAGWLVARADREYRRVWRRTFWMRVRYPIRAWRWRRWGPVLRLLGGERSQGFCLDLYMPGFLEGLYQQSPAVVPLISITGTGEEVRFYPPGSRVPEYTFEVTSDE